MKDLLKLAKAYICEKCGAKFPNNAMLDRHILICTFTQNENVVKVSDGIWTRSRNLIM